MALYIWILSFRKHRLWQEKHRPQTLQYIPGRADEYPNARLTAHSHPHIFCRIVFHYLPGSHHPAGAVIPVYQKQTHAIWSHAFCNLSFRSYEHPTFRIQPADSSRGYTHYLRTDHGQIHSPSTIRQSWQEVCEVRHIHKDWVPTGNAEMSLAF